MSHLGSLSKEKFLDTLNKQLEKIKDPPQKLKKKIEDVRFSYRFYKKYESTFQMLFDKLVINKQLK
jgi:flagellar biosynthesis chaperone FliJ